MHESELEKYDFKQKRLWYVLISLWSLNALILTIAWWGGHYLIGVKGHVWMQMPLDALLITHTIIKIVLTIFIIGGTIERTPLLFDKTPKE